MNPGSAAPFLVSIVVPAYNEELLLGPTLESIKQAATVFRDRGWDYELVVCDNNSTDRTPTIASDAGARVIFEPVNQIGKARNRGASASVGQWLIFVDADSHPSRELFVDVARAISSGDCIAGGVTLRMETPSRLGRLAVAFWNRVSRAFRLLAGSFIFCEARTFRDLGGFDESLYASEEIDLSSRLKRAGRTQGKRLVILTAHPLLTSSRKVHLYSLREHLTVVLKALLTGKRSLRDPKHCATWYDGRR